MKIYRDNQKLLVAAIAACLLGALAHTAHAGHERYYRRGRQELANKQYRHAERSLFRAYKWAKREQGDKINPGYVVYFCKALVMREYWSVALETCAEAVKLAKGSLAPVAAKYNNLAKKGKLIDKSAYRAKWAQRSLRNGLHDRAATEFREAIKLYPRARYYLGLCAALAGGKKLNAAAAACKRATKMNGAAGVAERARKLLAKLSKAKASAPSPAQAAIVGKLFTVLTNVQFINLKRHYRRRERVRHLAVTKSCLDLTKAAVAAGVSSSRRIRVVRIRGIKTSKARRHVNGRLMGWSHFAPLSAVARLCRRYDSTLKSFAVRSVLQSTAKTFATADKLDRADRLSDTDLLPLIMAAKPCIAAVRRALVVFKLDPNTVIATKYKGNVKLGEANKLICLKLQARYDHLFAKVAAARKAELEAKLAPYKKLLRGGKLKTFLRYGMIDLIVYTRRKRRLNRARDFRRASVWFQEMTYTHNCRVRVCWRLRRFQFRGNRLRRTTERTGLGGDAPTRRFR